MRERFRFLGTVAVVLTALLGVLAPATAAAGESVGVQAAHEVLIENADGRWEHFRVDNCALVHRWEKTAGGSLDWSGWTSLGGCLLYDQIDVERNADGRLEAFGVGTDKQMFHIWQRSAGGWSGWAAMGGGFNGPPTATVNSSGGIIVYAAGLDNQRYRKHQTQPNCCWTSTWVRG